eukprot:2790082-Prymnesium_polylepis.1
MPGDAGMPSRTTTAGGTLGTRGGGAGASSSSSTPSISWASTSTSPFTDSAETSTSALAATEISSGLDGTWFRSYSVSSCSCGANGQSARSLLLEWRGARQ